MHDISVCIDTRKHAFTHTHTHTNTLTHTRTHNYTHTHTLPEDTSAAAESVIYI